MKLFSLALSVLTLTGTLYFLLTDLPDLTSFNGFIYLFLMLLLLLICVTGILINIPEKRHKVYYKYGLSFK